MWIPGASARIPGVSDPTLPQPDRRPTLVVGLLGGVASGKSTVASALAGEDGDVIAADALAQSVLDRPETVDHIRAEFGAELIGTDGRPDRAALGSRVFADPDARARLESWIHPEVRATIRARLEEGRRRAAAVIVLDVPLLLEHDAQHGLANECDALVFVDTPDTAREARARADRGWTEGEVARRERAQLSLAEKRRRADHVLPNDGTRPELTAAALALRARLLEGAEGAPD